MKPLTCFKFFLWYFTRFKVPMIGYVKPRLLALSDEQIVIRLKLNRRSKNHLNSMYFGALAVGADLAGGLHGFYHAKKMKMNVSLVFKSFEARFLKRPETDVYFICDMGITVKQMLLDAKQSGERITQPIEVRACINYPTSAEIVALFTLELSVKICI